MIKTISGDETNEVHTYTQLTRRPIATLKPVITRVTACEYRKKDRNQVETRDGLAHVAFHTMKNPDHPECNQRQRSMWNQSWGAPQPAPLLAQCVVLLLVEHHGSMFSL